MVKRAVEEGVDFIWPADDVAFKTGLYLPPKIMKEMWIPHLERIIEPAISAGKPVMFHSDGKIDDIIPWLIDIGVDCINPMDPYGVDYREYKKKFGNRVCLSGNIDVEYPLAHGTPDDVEKDVKEHMEVLKPGSGYVASSSHSMVNFIPHENYQAMINAIHKYGNYVGEKWTFPATEIEETGNIKKEREAGAVDYRSSVKAGDMQKIYDSIYNGELFLPELLLAAQAMQEAMEILTPLVEGSRKSVTKGTVLIGTIKGDLHDIGKNIVRALLKGNGYEVIDIGVDNSPEKFLAAVEKHEPDVVGYSGLLTTTLAGIPEQMEALRKQGLRNKVITIVGGAPVSKEFAERNGVDLYGKDANEAVKAIEKALYDKRSD